MRNQQTFSAAAADDDEREQNVRYPFCPILVGRSANVRALKAERVRSSRVACHPHLSSSSSSSSSWSLVGYGAVGVGGLPAAGRATRFSSSRETCLYVHHTFFIIIFFFFFFTAVHVKIFQRHMVRQHKTPTHMRVCVYITFYFYFFLVRMLDFKPEEEEEEEEVPATIQNLEFSTSPNSFCPLVVVCRVRTIFAPCRYVFLDNCLIVLLGWSQADWPSLGNPCEAKDLWQQATTRIQGNPIPPLISSSKDPPSSAHSARSHKHRIVQG